MIIDLDLDHVMEMHYINVIYYYHYNVLDLQPRSNWQS